MRKKIKDPRLAFFITMIWLSFHAFGVIVMIYADNASPLFAALFVDSFFVLAAFFLVDRHTTLQR